MITFLRRKRPASMTTTPRALPAFLRDAEVRCVGVLYDMRRDAFGCDWIVYYSDDLTKGVESWVRN